MIKNLNFIPFLFSILIFPFLLGSCRDDRQEDVDYGNVKITKLKVTFSPVTFQNKQLRSQFNSLEEDSHVRNAYLFIFRSSTGELVRSRFFPSIKGSTKPDFAFDATKEILERYKNVNGKYDFFIVGNVIEKDDPTSVNTVFKNATQEALGKIRTRQALIDFIADTKAKRDRITDEEASRGETSVEGITTSTILSREDHQLLFTGALRNVDVDKLSSNPNATVSGSNATLSIPMKRLCSKVKFKISIDEDALKKKLQDEENKKNPDEHTHDIYKKADFDLISWQVFETPKEIPLFPTLVSDPKNTPAVEIKDNPLSNPGVKFIDSKPQIDVDESGNDYSFGFYTIGNMKTPQKMITANVDDSRNPIYLREKREKTPYTTGGGRQKVTNGNFIYAPQNATYVKIKGQLRVTKTVLVDDVEKPGTKYRRTLQDLIKVEYTIHLGNPDGSGHLDLNNYDVDGNTNYVYNVKILGFNDISVEVDANQGTNVNSEQNPGVEGTIYTDMQYFNLDAHYAQVVLKVNKSIINNDQPYYVETPFDNPSLPSGGKKDLNWVVFEPIPKSMVTFDPETHRPAFNQMPVYPGDDVVKTSRNAGPVVNAGTLNTKKKVYRVDEIQDLVKYKWEHKSEDPNFFYGNPDDGNVAFAAFVNEYYYETNPLNPDQAAPADFWKQFVNNRPRKMFINMGTPKESYDSHSVRTRSVVEIRQVAIQSIYDRSSTVAVGSEVFDETYGSLNTDWDAFKKTEGTDYAYKGRIACAAEWGLLDNPNPNKRYKDQDFNQNLPRWDRYLRITRKGNGEDVADVHGLDEELGGWYGTIRMRAKTDDDFNAINPSDKAPDAQYRDYVTYVAENCLSRNRDNNHNGVIDPDEIRWFTPTVSVLWDMVFSRYAFQLPNFMLFPETESDPITAPFLEKAIAQKIDGPNGTKIDPPFPQPVNTPAPYVMYFSSSAGTQWESYSKSPYSNVTLWGHENFPLSNSLVWNSYDSKADGRTYERFFTRCVRALGDGIMSFPLHYDPTTRVFDLRPRSGEETSYPSVAYRNTDINPHPGDYPSQTVFTHSRLNRPAMRFQFAKNDTYGRCAEYSEKADRSDIGKWRLPNQAEMQCVSRIRNSLKTDAEKNALVTIHDLLTNTYFAPGSSRYYQYSRGSLYLSPGGVNRCVHELGSNDSPIKSE